mmetsp:Transcript_21780/g.35978  ORF Transcript_21780/g.35978 Transcript_21780/m.35978 type:complete len:238 (+) Transcript_21780:86-799(+)
MVLPIEPRCISTRTDHLILNATLVVSATNSEIAILPPVRVPTVGHLPILGATLNSPTDEFDRMSARHTARDVMVDAASIILEVREDSESCFNRPALHHHSLNCLLPGRSLDGSLEGSLVAPELIVRGRSRGVARSWARLRLLGRTTGVAFGRVRVVTFRAMMVAVRQREIRAEAFAERAGTLVLPAGDSTLGFDERPRRVDLPTVAAARENTASAKAYILCRQREDHLGFGGDTHPI